MEGDITPFLKLTEWVFRKLPEDLRDFVLKLVIYKAQNPAKKVEIAPLLIGPTGSGKSLWADIVRDAFGKYGKVASVKTIMNNFNSFMEHAMFVQIDEAERADMEKITEELKSLITGKKLELNAKHRKQYEIANYAMFYISSNKRAVGAFSPDDRRMFVMQAPKRHPDDEAFYRDYVVAWKDDNGPKKLMHWMLEYDLKGWKPPLRPPLTSEKIMARIENMSLAEKLATEMKEHGVDRVIMWLDAAQAWCTEAAGNDKTAEQAKQVQTALHAFEVRPFYTAEELCLMFPDIVESLRLEKAADTRATVAGKMSAVLRDWEIQFLQNKNDPHGFKWRGRTQNYLRVILSNVCDQLGLYQKMRT